MSIVLFVLYIRYYGITSFSPRVVILLFHTKLRFFDGQICTNGFLDASNDGGTLYTTLKDCCEDVFPQGTCDFNDICFTDSPTPSPTYSSTNGSTPTVSKETTGPPTTAIVPRRGTGAHKVSH